MTSRLVVVCVSALCLVAFSADHVSSSQAKGDCSNPQHAVSHTTSPHSHGSWLINQLKEGHAHLKEQLQEGDSDVKELLREGDARLKELLVEGVTRLKEQQAEDTGRMKVLVNEENGRLKQRLTEEVGRLREERKEGDDWLRDQVTRAESHMTEELTREATQMKKQLQGQQEAADIFQKTMTEMAKKNQAAMEELREEVASLTEQLQVSKDKLEAQQTSNDHVTAQLESLQSEVNRARLTSPQDTATHTGQGMTQLTNSTGSTFVRWGRTTCPDNAVLVYSGIAGGGRSHHTGTGANRLCLTMEPQFDNVTVPPDRDWLYGAEYDGIPGHENWDVPCALCRAPRPTTVMVPATLTCPPGWALQYTGHLASHKFDFAAATEFVCLDAEIENRPGSANDQASNLYYYTLSECGSLPCPPYIQNRVVTCVVCSL